VRFRSDINGLRAVAVAGVVLFHFGARGFGGGFVGVDIFFVISGFLMTGIIVGRFEQGRFSIRQFYMDRVRRIVPALTVLCLFLIALGYIILPPDEYRLLGKHVAGSIAFVSNIFYWSEAGYFDPESRTKWLLHTWSLSVEAQFYLLYPLFLAVVLKLRSRSAQRLLVLAATAVSLLVCIIGSLKWPTAAFYFLPMRAWELMAGGLVCLYPLKAGPRARTCIAIGGLLLLVFSVAWLRRNDIWPGWLALLPVLGTAAVIAAGRVDLVILNNPVFQFLGRISYSVYLWHWPLVVAANYYGKPDPAVEAAAVLLSILLGWASYRYVEQPARLIAVWRQLRIDKSFRGVAITSAWVFLLAVAVYASHGAPFRLDRRAKAQLVSLDMPTIANGWCLYSVDTMSNLAVGEDGLRCWLGSRSAVTRGLLFGDSYAAQYDPFWNAIGAANHVKINSITTNWCYPSLGRGFTGDPASRAFDQCQLNRDFVQKNIGSYDFVVLAGQWGNVLDEGKMQSVHDLIMFAAKHSRLVVIMPSPRSFDVDIRNKYEASLLLGATFRIDRYGHTYDADALRANSDLAAYARQFGNVMYLDRGDVFNSYGRPSDVTEQGIPFSLDGFHISILGSRSAAQGFTRTTPYQTLMARITATHTSPAPSHWPYRQKFIQAASM
jgi:peptidoglycan/LPS O-acetylase OafA/YrhL